MKEDKLDWFAAVTLNPDKDYANFSIAGYDDRNTIMKSPEEYKKNKATSRSLYFTLNENQSLKEYKTKYEDLNKSFNETLEEQKKPLLEENNTLKTENQNLKTENTENKKQLEKYQEFFTRVKKYYGDRFSDFLEKIKPKTTIKPK